MIEYELEMPLHQLAVEALVTTAVGLTVMVKVISGPVQPLFVGVTLMVAVMGAVVLLVAVKPGILPEPLAASPMEGVLFIQSYTVAGWEPEKVTVGVEAPLQTEKLATLFTVGS